jgi:esterase
MNLNFQEYGKGQPLLILHGLLGSLDNWHTLSKSFSASFRVLAVDQRNHGRSPHSDVFTYDAMAQDLVEFLDRLQIKSASVLGHSMGGKTAMQLALSHPERVEKLIVVDIAPRAYPPLHDELLDALLSINLAVYHSRQQIDKALEVRVPDFAVRQFLLKNLHRDASEKFSWKANLDVISRNYKEIARQINARGPFPKPALFVKGSRSSYILDSDTQDIRRMFPLATISTLDSGHWIHADTPEPFADLVVRFLEKASG